jgi:hypothetical protein
MNIIIASFSHHADIIGPLAIYVAIGVAVLLGLRRSAEDE